MFAYEGEKMECLIKLGSIERKKKSTCIINNYFLPFLSQFFSKINIYTHTVNTYVDFIAEYLIFQVN